MHHRFQNICPFYKDISRRHRYLWTGPYVAPFIFYFLFFLRCCPLRIVHYVFNPDHYFGIVIANTTLLCIGECPSNSPFLKNNGAEVRGHSPT